VAEDKRNDDGDLTRVRRRNKVENDGECPFHCQDGGGDVSVKKKAGI
jgi:hypothetical protein